MTKRITVPEIRDRKGGTPIVCLTAYTTPMARLLDPLADVILVGDSLGMVVYGFETTIPVTPEMMAAHGAAVMRGSTRACVVVDLPFGSYQESPEAAFRVAARMMAETGCSAVKLEGGVEMAPTVRFLTRRGVPVMGHIGMTPQAVHVFGGFKSQGRDDEAARRIRGDAEAIAEAGAFAIVLEAVREPIGREITAAVPVPVIGIGASPQCDGQILVTEDILGLAGPFKPRFVRRYAELGEAVSKAAEAYAEDVRARRFPGPENCYGIEKKTPRNG